MAKKIAKNELFHLLLDDYRDVDRYKLDVYTGEMLKHRIIESSKLKIDPFDLSKEYLCIVYPMTCSGFIMPIAEVFNEE